MWIWSFMLCNMHPHSWWCIYYIHITMSMSDNYIPGAKINLVRVPTYVRFMKRSSISTYYHIIYFPQCQDLFSRNVLGLAMRMFPPRRRVAQNPDFFLFTVCSVWIFFSNHGILIQTCLFWKQGRVKFVRYIFVLLTENG